MTRSSSQLKNTNNSKNCLPDRWDGVCLLVFFSTKYLLGCADNRSELHCKDERDSGDESRGGIHKAVIRLLWFRFGRQPALLTRYPF